MNNDSLKGQCVVVEASYAGGEPVFTPTEEKLIRLGLCRAAQPGEVRNSATKLFESLRRRSVSAEDIIAASERTMTRSSQAVALQRARTRPMPFGQYKVLTARQPDKKTSSKGQVKQVGKPDEDFRVQIGLMLHVVG